jgi:SAM-dependent methyltransferase
MGFDGLLGVDAFVDADMITSSGVPIKKRRLSEVEGEFDLIMFHHSFEHVPSPRDELQEVHRRLRPGGRCLIRIPTPSSEAWEKYGTDWVQLDAPRHLTLISRPGMTALAQQCGFSIAEEIDDSNGWSFMASELYRRDIPLREQSQEAHFSPDEISTYEKRATAANAAGRGDKAAFILVRS